MIYPGQVVRFPCTFKTALGVLTDPTAVIYRLFEPVGTETVYVYPCVEVTRTVTGRYALTV